MRQLMLELDRVVKLILADFPAEVVGHDMAAAHVRGMTVSALRILEALSTALDKQVPLVAKEACCSMHVTSAILAGLTLLSGKVIEDLPEEDREIATDTARNYSRAIAKVANDSPTFEVGTGTTH